jgi:hypothetical protein
MNFKIILISLGFVLITACNQGENPQAVPPIELLGFIDMHQVEIGKPGHLDDTDDRCELRDTSISCRYQNKVGDSRYITIQNGIVTRFLIAKDEIDFSNVELIINRLLFSVNLKLSNFNQAVDGTLNYQASNAEILIYHTPWYSDISIATGIVIEVNKNREMDFPIIETEGARPSILGLQIGSEVDESLFNVYECDDNPITKSISCQREQENSKLNFGSFDGRFYLVRQSYSLTAEVEPHVSSILQNWKNMYGNGVTFKTIDWNYEEAIIGMLPSNDIIQIRRSGNSLSLMILDANHPGSHERRKEYQSKSDNCVEPRSSNFCM